MGDTLQVVANRYPPPPPFTIEPNPPNPFRLLWIHQHEVGWRVVRADYITPTIHTFSDLGDAVQDAEGRMVEGSLGGAMKTLDEVEHYFREKEYVVRPYSNLSEGQQGIAVHGRALDTGYMGLIRLGSTGIIISSGDTWILRLLYVPHFKDEHFDKLESLLIVAKEILGPSREPPKES